MVINRGRAHASSPTQHEPSVVLGECLSIHQSIPSETEILVGFCRGGVAPSLTHRRVHRATSNRKRSLPLLDRCQKTWIFTQGHEGFSVPGS